jgi:hypothetical protein
MTRGTIALLVLAVQEGMVARFSDQAPRFLDRLAGAVAAK